MIEGRDPEFKELTLRLYLEECGREAALVSESERAEWLRNFRNGLTGEQARAAFHNSTEAIAFRARPPAPILPHLEIRGRDFVDTHGERMVFCGCDAFLTFRQFLNGEDLAPFFEESKQLGFALWRVFMMGSKRQNAVMDLNPNEVGYYDKVRPFADRLNAHGIVLLATIFVDAQDVMPDAATRRAHWTAMAARLRGSVTLLSGGNEYHKNGFDPGELSDPGMLWSRGSDLADAAPYRPYGSFAEFHPRRDMPAMMMDTVASPVFIHGTNGLTGPLIIDEPIGFAETDQPGRRSNDPRMSYRLARHYATECGGAVFHSDAGQRGQLLGPTTRVCAKAWVRGMTL